MSARGRGAVAAGHPLTTEVGARVLEEGGNAVDVACACAFASFVSESPLTGPGGGGFMLVHSEQGQELIDFFVAVPGKGGRLVKPSQDAAVVEIRFGGTTPVRYYVGGAVVAVPGMLRGLAFAHARHGSLPWAELVRPAVELARRGVEVTPAQAYIQRILDLILRNTPEGRSVYGEERLIDAGETLRMPELADTLELFAADGVETLYQGELAERLVEVVADAGGSMTKQDLAEYEVLVREPARTRYQGLELVTNPPPASGGVLVAYTLGLLERLDLAGGPLSAEATAALAEAMRSTAERRDRRFYEDLYGDELASELLSRQRLDRDAAEIAERLAARRRGQALGEADGWPATTHVAVIDQGGMAVSMTTSTGSAPSLYLPGTGLSLNTMLGEADLLPQPMDPLDDVEHAESLKPGLRLTSMMAPSLLHEDGQVRLVVGSAGSTRLRTAIVQVILNFVGHGLPLKAALAQPRVHLDGATLHVEGGFAYEEVEKLEQMGYRLQLWPGIDFYFGGAAAVAVSEDGFEAAGDARRGGDGQVV